MEKRVEKGGFVGPFLCFCDGAARGNPGQAAAAFIGFDFLGRLIGKKQKRLGIRTNNEAEYEAILMCLAFLEVLAREGELARKGVVVCCDSQLVVNQMRGVYKVKERRLQDLVMEAKRRQRRLGVRVDYVLVPREMNLWADGMVNEELDGMVVSDSEGETQISPF